MKSPASPSRELVTALAALLLAVVVAIPAAAAPPAEQMPCHDVTRPDAAAAVPGVAAQVDGDEVAAAVAEGGPNPFADRFSNVVLLTHEGKPVRFYDDLLKGKIVMINFMYATCKGR